LEIQDVRSIILLAVALTYVGILGRVAVWRPPAGVAWRLLIVYAVIGGAGAGLESAREYSWLAGWQADVLNHLPLYAAMSLSVILLPLTNAFLHTKAKTNRWVWFGGFWLVAAFVLDSNLLVLASVLVQWPGWYIGRAALAQAALAVGWGLFTAKSALLALQTYRRTSQPLHRNRQAYWAIGITLHVVAVGVVLLRQDVAGILVFLAAGLVITLGVVTHSLPDVRRTMRLGLALMATGALAIAAYTTAILSAPLIQQLLPGINGTLMAVMMAAVIVLIANPLLARLQRGLSRWSSGARYDPQKLVGEYSLKIGGILELDRLARVALDLIREAIGMEHAALFVVDPPASDAEAAQFYGLRLAGAIGPAVSSGAVLADSPIAAHFTQEFAALTQYDLDLNPHFNTASASERVWLLGMAMDVYVPIYASQQWIGLFALGPKTSRYRYFEDDLQLVGTLADQTAVALQNARLVDDLMRLNGQIREANTALDQANQRLAHLDRIKSDFINVISHELRTPMSILYGYAQILLGEVGEGGDDYHRQVVEGINTGTTRMQEIIENMLDVTKIDSRALVLSSKPVSLEIIVNQVLAKLKRPLAERQLQVESARLATLPPVEADAAALSKVFHHLIVNAVKFTPDGGHITVTGRCVDAEMPGGAVEISIADTGIGIDPRFLDLIFTKFYQMGEIALHSSGKTKFKGGGPGLGLAIARGIVEAHGGNLRAESSGHDETMLPGSRFVVLLPLAQPRIRDNQ
jgi:signal transduction histidine kinase